GFPHLRVALDGTRVVIDGFIKQLRVLVNVPFQQREVWFVGQHGVVLIGYRQRVVVAAEVIQVVGKINGGIAVLRQLLQDLVAQLGGLGVVALVQQNAFALAHHPRIVVHSAGGAV